MKIAFTTSGQDMNAPLDSRFGRAPRFLIYDLARECFECVDNRRNLNAAQGAGIQSAETVARLGVGAIVTEHCGPKAFRVLKAAGVTIYNTDAPTLTEALSRYHAGTLTEATTADVDSHW